MRVLSLHHYFRIRGQASDSEVATAKKEEIYLCSKRNYEKGVNEFEVTNGSAEILADLSAHQSEFSSMSIQLDPGYLNECSTSVQGVSNSYNTDFDLRCHSELGLTSSGR